MAGSVIFKEVDGDIQLTYKLGVGKRSRAIRRTVVKGGDVAALETEITTTLDGVRDRLRKLEKVNQ